MERGCRVSIQPSDDTQTPLHGMKRASREVGRGLKHFEARVVRLRSVLLGLSTCFEPEASSLGIFFRAVSLKDITPVLGLCVSFPPPQLKHQIMNSLLQQEAISTECTFKFELITNNLHPHSREL